MDELAEVEEALEEVATAMADSVAALAKTEMEAVEELAMVEYLTLASVEALLAL